MRRSPRKPRPTSCLTSFELTEPFVVPQDGHREWADSIEQYLHLVRLTASIPLSSAASVGRPVEAGPARIRAQLRDPGNPSNGNKQAPSDGGDQQRHAQRDGACEP